MYARWDRELTAAESDWAPSWIWAPPLLALPLCLFVGPVSDLFGRRTCSYLFSGFDGGKGHRRTSAPHAAQHGAPWMAQASAQADVIQVTKQLSAKLRRNQWRQALQLYRAAWQDGLQTNLVTFNVFLKALAFALAWASCLKHLSQARTCDLISFNTVGSSVSQWRITLQLLETTSIHTLRPDVFSLSSACNACRHQWHHSLQLLRQAELWSCPPNCILCAAVTSACEPTGRWHLALQLLRRALRLAVDVVNVNAAISALAVAGRHAEARQLLEALPASELRPSLVSYNSAIHACERRGAWPHALRLLGRLGASRRRPDVISYGAALSACEKGRQPFKALRLLREMRRGSVAPNEVCCSAAISACEKIGAWTRALNVLFSMPSERLLANVISFNACISACEKGNSWLCAFQLFAAASMRDEITYRAAITAACQELCWQPALQLLRQMEDLCLEVGAEACSYLVNACDSHRRVRSTQALLKQLGPSAIIRLRSFSKKGSRKQVWKEFDIYIYIYTKAWRRDWWPGNSCHVSSGFE